MTSGELQTGYRRAIKITMLFLAYLLLSVIAVELKKNYAPMNHPLGSEPNVLAGIRYALWGTSVSIFFLIRFLLRILDKGVRKKNLTGKKLVNKFVMGNIMKDCLCVAVALYGRALFYLGGRPADFYSFLVASLVMFAYYFPRFGDWQERWRSIVRPV